MGDGQYRLDINFQRAAADQAGIKLRVLIEIEGQRARPLGFHYLLRRLPDFGFHATAADGAENGAIVAHQHLGRLKRRNGAAHIDDCGQRPSPAFAAQTHDLFENIHEHILDRRG